MISIGLNWIKRPQNIFSDIYCKYFRQAETITLSVSDKVTPREDSASKNGSFLCEAISNIANILVLDKFSITLPDYQISKHPRARTGLPVCPKIHFLSHLTCILAKGPLLSNARRVLRSSGPKVHEDPCLKEKMNKKYVNQIIFNLV